MEQEKELGQELKQQATGPVAEPVAAQEAKLEPVQKLEQEPVAAQEAKLEPVQNTEQEPAKGKWYEDPDGVTKVGALVLLVALSAGVCYFAGDFVEKTFTLAVSGNVDGLAAYLRSFGNWAIVISFLIDVLINAGSIFPSIFLSTANGLIFGLPLGITVSWLAETTGVVLSFLLMRFFFRNTAESIIKKANRLQDIDRASEHNGLIWMTFARALPYFPSGILTAIGAVSRMSVRDYVLANLIGKFPSTALEVVIGHDVVNFQQNSQRLGILVVVCALVVWWGKKKCFEKK